MMRVTQTLVADAPQSGLGALIVPVLHRRRDRPCDDGNAHRRHDRVRFCEVAHTIGATLDGCATGETENGHRGHNYLDIHEHSL